MNLRRACMGMLAVLMASLAVVAHAADEDNSSGVPMPVIPMGLGDSCVKDTDFMRRNHMDMLKHQREETMLKGIRVEQYSLKECISCHAVNGPDSTPVTVASPQHFCRSCHDYAAVSIDCFQCHASRPESGDSSAGHGLSSIFPTTQNVSGSQ
ncbi:Hdr-like menaquinol oxidoreductase cytochrome c subunit [Pseudomonadota bacterium]